MLYKTQMQSQQYFQFQKSLVILSLLKCDLIRYLKYKDVEKAIQ
jgi:hypothetical protein